MARDREPDNVSEHQVFGDRPASLGVCQRARGRQRRKPEPALNIALWERLRSRQPQWSDAAELAASLRLPLDRLLHDVARLERFGFLFEKHPHYGLRCAAPARGLCPDQIEWELNTRLIGRRIAVWNRVTSTNDLAGRAARSRANDGLVVLAEEQVCGRGRHGRAWHAPPSSAVLMSVLVFQDARERDATLVTCLASIAVAESVEEATGVPARIKWPNDVLIAGRKVAGILVEQGAGTVIGIGVNCTIAPDQFPPELRDTAGSLCQFTSEPIDRSRVVQRLIQRLDGRFHEIRTIGPQPTWKAWCERLARC